VVRIISGVFLCLHGVVFLFYACQSFRVFELQPGLQWPDRSWGFSNLLGDEVTRVLAGAVCIVTAIGFIAGGVGLMTEQKWWSVFVLGAAGISGMFLVLFWDGRMQQLDDKGGIGLLINIVIILVLLLVPQSFYGV